MQWNEMFVSLVLLMSIGLAMNDNKVHGLLRTNPDWEQDIEETCVVDDGIRARVATYTHTHTWRRRRRERSRCSCQVCENGVAPWVQLNDGRQFPALGLGTWLGLSKSGGRVEVKDEEVRAAVEWAIDAGYRHIDTAFIYNTEEQVGKAVNNKIAEGVVKREDLFITTKLWNDKHAQDAVVPALKTSLEILNLTYVDLYLIHWPVATNADGSISETDYVDTWRGMIQARDQGLTKSIGVSNFNINQLDRLLANTSVTPANLQVEINLNLQQPALLAFCRSHNITVTGYTPFGSLFYKKASEDAPPPRIDDAALSALAAKYNKTVPQLALRYLHELGVVPIPKSVTKKRIEQNLNIFDFSLTPQEHEMMKSYDRNYRTIPVVHWKHSPYYPFEKDQK